MPPAPPLSCHKVLRSQIKVYIDWMIVPLEENKCVILPALSFSAYFSAFICSKHASHYVNKGNSPEDRGTARSLLSSLWACCAAGHKMAVTGVSQRLIMVEFELISLRVCSRQ